jgi:hypothetical protein
MNETIPGFAERCYDGDRKALTDAFQELLSEFPINAIESAVRTVRRDGPLFTSAAEILDAACKLLRAKGKVARHAAASSAAPSRDRA